MPAQPFEPVYMSVGVLTAALQELTPRDRRDPDPDLAVEEWLGFADAVGADCIELSAAIHPDLSDIPAEAMLDPVANTLDLRQPFDKDRLLAGCSPLCGATGVDIADVAYFDNMLHDDPAIRQQKVDFDDVDNGCRRAVGSAGPSAGSSDVTRRSRWTRT